jgi:hypothetical protein
MGKTYKKQSNRYDDEHSSGRGGKHSKHSNGKKTGGMRTLNSYADEEFDDDPFDDEIGIDDEIFIEHIRDDK